MVRIAAPPPERPPFPIFHILPAGSAIVRIFDPARHNTTALTFRHFGPLARFDHQRISHPQGFAGGSSGDFLEQAQDDPERGVYYCAPSFSSCLVEVFGDTGIIEIGSRCVYYPQVTRELKLLDLRDSGAMKAGSVAALSKVAERSLSQAWSRYFYLFGREDPPRPEGWGWDESPVRRRGSMPLSLTISVRTQQTCPAPVRSVSTPQR